MFAVDVLVEGGSVGCALEGLEAHLALDALSGGILEKLLVDLYHTSGKERASYGLQLRAFTASRVLCVALALLLCFCAVAHF